MRGENIDLLPVKHLHRHGLASRPSRPRLAQVIKPPFQLTPPNGLSPGPLSPDGAGPALPSRPLDRC